jgi:hypothetical protein
MRNNINRVRPTNYVLPVLAVHQNNYVEDFLGTGVFVGYPPLLVTAEHVVREWSGAYAILTWSLRDHRVIQANLLHSRRDIDLAVLEVPDYPLDRGLELAQDDEILQNRLVVCYEYSRTYLSEQSRELNLRQTTRLGNVTSFCDLSDLYDKAGEDALELSFAALKGASGAPVLSNDNLRLWGIVKSNVDYHLLPVQTIILKDNETPVSEETNYMLPQGIAIHVKHLRQMLQELGRLPGS